MAYRILEVAGHAPHQISDFVGAQSFTVETGLRNSRVSGIGSNTGIGVIFRQRGTRHPSTSGRARFRDWRICAVPGTGFMAEVVPAPDRPVAAASQQQRQK
jgi:hypothetical protein